LPGAPNAAAQLTDNFVRCDIDGKQGVEFRMSPPSYAISHGNPYSNIDPDLGETLLLAFDKNGVSVQADFPGKTTIDYSLTKKDEARAYGIHYGIGTTGQSFDTKLENGDTYHINVTKYEGNSIEGTFSGEVTDQKSDSTRVRLSNCSFKSSLQIGAQ
jgi:hypothetical protein